MIDLKESHQGKIPPVQFGEIIKDIKIVGDGHYKGDGIARVDGYIIFVSNTKKGDRVDIEITIVKDNFARGEVI